MLKIKSHTSSAKNYSVPAFLHADALDALWANDVLCAEVTSWSGEPLEIWFSNDGEIYMGCAYFSDNSLSFSNGRHRTKWMMQQGFKYIPVCLSSSSYYEALQAGLISHRAFDGQLVE